MDIGFRAILLIVVTIMVLFGARRIPEMMKSIGQGVKEFKKAAREISPDNDLSDKRA
jgi:sec-independent protein translocase protein TatA